MLTVNMSRAGRCATAKSRLNPGKGIYFFWAKEGDKRYYVQTPIARTYIEEIP